MFPSGVSPPLPGAERFAPEGGIWLLDEPIGAFAVGTEIEGAVGIIDFGGRAVVRVGEELVTARSVAEGESVTAAVEQRVLLTADPRVCRRPSPSEVIPFDEAERAMKSEDGGARALRGPKTLEESMRGTCQRGAGGFMRAHNRWIVESRIDPGRAAPTSTRWCRKRYTWRRASTVST